MRNCCSWNRRESPGTSAISLCSLSQSPDQSTLPCCFTMQAIWSFSPSYLREFSAQLSSSQRIKPCLASEVRDEAMKISKSKFVAGVQCLKRLYFLVHDPELGAQPDGADEAIMEQGREVGLLARRLFPGGVEVDGSGGLQAAIHKTKELVADPKVPAIFEAAFEYRNVVVRVDVLHRRRDGRWRLVEVKSTTAVKEHHLEDVAIQSRVVSGCGVDLSSTCLTHINRNYVLQGGTIDPRRLFKIRNLTRRVQRLQPALVFQLRSQFRVLAMPTAPDLPTGPHCTTPVTCEFYDHCNLPKPSHHIGYLPRLHASAMEELEEL